MYSVINIKCVAAIEFKAPTGIIEVMGYYEVLRVYSDYQ